MSPAHLPQITVYSPSVPNGCWQTSGVPSIPVLRLDAAGAAVGPDLSIPPTVIQISSTTWQVDSSPEHVSLLTSSGYNLYVVAGKTETGYQRSLYIYDALKNVWTTGASLPSTYAAVENAGAVSLNGLLYVMGGSTRFGSDYLCFDLILKFTPPEPDLVYLPHCCLRLHRTILCLSLLGCFVLPLLEHLDIAPFHVSSERRACSGDPWREDLRGWWDEPDWTIA